MPRFYKKSIIRIKWLKKQINLGKDKYLIAELFKKKYKTQRDVFYELWNYINHNKNPKSWNHRKRIIKLSKTKEYLGDKNRCYFGGNGKLIEHHISYYPEKVIVITKQNHRRLHKIIEKYHNEIYEKDKIISHIQKITQISRPKLNHKVN